jgi:UDP-N-acetyl-D-galactosamine dehydrogenase
MGLTFKENCPDLRNTRITDLVATLKAYNCKVDVYDPWADNQEAKKELGISLISTLAKDMYDAIVLGVPHDKFKQLGAVAIRALGKKQSILYDIKYMLSKHESDLRL